jgi:hypothetical protein
MFSKKAIDAAAKQVSDATGKNSPLAEVVRSANLPGTSSPAIPNTMPNIVKKSI